MDTAALYVCVLFRSEVATAGKNVRLLQNRGQRALIWRRSVEFSLEKHEDELFRSVCSNKKILVLLPSVWIRGEKRKRRFCN